MSLQTKILRALVLVVAVVAALDYAGVRWGILPSFVAIEEQRAHDSVEAILGILEDEERELETVAALTALRATAGAGGLDGWREQADLDLLFHVRTVETGTPNLVPISFAEVVDAETGEPLSLREFPLGGLHDGHHALMFAYEAAGEPRAEDHLGEAGWMLVTAGDRSLDLLLASHKIGDDVVFVGRFLDEEMREAVGAESAVEFEILPLEESSVGGDRDFFREVTPMTAGTVLGKGDEDSLRAWRSFDKYGGVGIPELLLRVDLPRDVVAKARGTGDFLLLTVAGATLALLFALWKILNTIVITPVATLTAHAVRVGEDDDTEARTGIVRDDEIGTLASEFDRMMERLADSRAQVVHTARLAGRSEIATGVLHNVGNVLNSVNVSSSMVRKQVDDLALGTLGEIVAVLEQQGDELPNFIANDPRGRHLLPFLGQLNESLGKQHGTLQKEVVSLCEGIEHIAELVRSQQSYAKTRGVFEPTSLAKEVDASLRMCEQAYGHAEEVEIVREYADVPRVVADKHKLMEILVNLLRNAKQAVKENGDSDRRIVLRTRMVGARPRIEVQDNGVGIAREHLAEVFHHGFTTKPDGHGFGLHVSANAATEMNARLFAESDGPGRGATFVLEFEELEEASQAA